MKATLFAAFVVLALAGAGCEQQPKAENSADAIRQAQALPEVEAQADYLLGQAKAFVRSEQYKEAVQTAQYVISNIPVEEHVNEAKRILQDASAKLEAEAKAAMGDAQKRLGL